MAVFVSTVKEPTPSSMNDFPQTPDTKKLPRLPWMWVFRPLLLFVLLCFCGFVLSQHGSTVCTNNDMYVQSCSSCFCGSKPFVFCALGICQCNPADAVLVLQRHRRRRVRSLVTETQRCPAGLGRQRGGPRPRVWGDREQPHGERKTKNLSTLKPTTDTFLVWICHYELSVDFTM